MILWTESQDNRGTKTNDSLNNDVALTFKNDELSRTVVIHRNKLYARLHE